MCTVTFIPGTNSCFITSNRDESPGRQASGLTSHHTPDWNAIHFPLDDSSGGSWIALADSGRTVCLLNGAFEPFAPDPPYRLSRGQIVLKTASTQDPHHFLDEFDLEGIAPFTLLLYEHHSLTEWVWDGIRKHITSLPSDIPQIWSSVTLYPPEVRAWRKSLFEHWLKKQNTIDRESIIQFHQQANGDTANDFVMDRAGIVRTLSITNVLLQEQTASMLHVDLDRQTREEILVHYGE